MNLDTVFANLDIVRMDKKRRLSGIYPQPLTASIVNAQDSCNNSSGSSIEEMDELYNENNTVQDNAVIEDISSTTVSMRRSSRKRIKTTTFDNAFLSGGYSSSGSKFAKLAINTTVHLLRLDSFAETDMDNGSVDYLKQIYLDKTVKLKYGALETIFEEPKLSGNGKIKPVFMSGRKFRRFISFDDTVSNITKKTRKRSMKAKTIISKTRKSISKLNIKEGERLVN